jgi:hypothetical protein
VSPSSPPDEPSPDEPWPKDDLTPEEEDELLRRAAEAEENVRTGNFITWEALFPAKRLAE